MCDKCAFREVPETLDTGSEIGKKKESDVMTAEEIYKRWLDRIEKKHRMGKYAEMMQEEW